MQVDGDKYFILTGTFMQIFMSLALKMRLHEIAQFYMVISWKFRLINHDYTRKLKLFRVIWYLNAFKVKYAWIKVQKYPHAKFGVIGGTTFVFRLKYFFINFIWNYFRKYTRMTLKIKDKEFHQTSIHIKTTMQNLCKFEALSRSDSASNLQNFCIFSYIIKMS